jgi:hypothetical protein
MNQTKAEGPISPKLWQSAIRILKVVVPTKRGVAQFLARLDFAFFQTLRDKLAQAVHIEAQVTTFPSEIGAGELLIHLSRQN